MNPPATRNLDGTYPKRYDLIEGFRGLAAVSVVCFHNEFFPLGRRGVEMFFVISGYCILASADSCLKKNTGALTFAWRRFFRIYPPYLCAFLFFIVTRLLKIAIDHVNQLAPYTALDFLQNATLTQWLTLLFHPIQLPPDYNPTLMVAAFWSLNYEVQFYLVVALVLFIAGRFRHASLNPLILVVTGASFIWTMIMGTSCNGLFIEYWPLFGLGCLVFMRLGQCQNPHARLAIDGFLLGLAVVCSVESFLPAPDRIFGPVTYSLMIGSIFSLVLVLVRGASEWMCRTLVGRVLAYAGVISYSLYLIHQFNLQLAKTVVTHLLPAATPHFLVLTGLVLFHLALASLFWFICERPFLNERISFAEIFKTTRLKTGAAVPASAPVSSEASYRA